MKHSQSISSGWARHRRLVGGIVVSLLLVAGCSDDTTSTGEGSTANTGATDGESLLGPVDKAEGEPVRIGFVGDGQSAAGDNQVELEVAAAAADYLNEYKAGIAGRPIELITCEAQSDPARATDCGNQMVEKEVVLVAVGATGVYESVWEPLHDAGIPTVFFAASGETILGDAESSFTFASPSFSLRDFPISVAKEEKADKVTAVVIDTPAAVDGYTSEAFEAAGLDFDLIRVPIGTADMTPQLQGLVDDAGVVHIVGNDTFCISALQALEALAFDGPITMLNFCLSDATRQAFPDGLLEGIQMPLTAPAGDDDASALYREVVQKYASGEVDFSLQGGVNIFALFGGIDVALDGLEGEVTPAAAIATMKSMDEAELPGGGGIRFRCDGTVEKEFPSVCVLNGLYTTLDDAGRPTTVNVTD